MLLSAPRAVTSFTQPIRHLPVAARGAMIRHPSQGLVSGGGKKARELI